MRLAALLTEIAAFTYRRCFAGACFEAALELRDADFGCDDIERKVRVREPLNAAARIRLGLRPESIPCCGKNSCHGQTCDNNQSQRNSTSVFTHVGTSSITILPQVRPDSIVRWAATTSSRPIVASIPTASSPAVTASTIS